MNFNTSKSKTILVITLFLTLIAYIIFQHTQKQNYMNYISDDLYQDIGNLNLAIVSGEGILNEVTSSQELSQRHAESLISYHHRISSISQKYRNLASQYLNRASHKELNNHAASNIASYFSKLQSQAGANPNYKLSEEDLEKVQAIQNLNSAWVEQVKKHTKELNVDNSQTGLVHIKQGNYRKLYENKDVEDDYWIDLLKDLSNETKRFEDEFFQRKTVKFDRYLSDYGA